MSNSTNGKVKKKRNYRKGNGRPRNAKVAESSSDRSNDERVKDAINDISWYVKSDRLLLDAASFPFPNPTGTRIKFDNANINDYRVPGIMKMTIVPAIGTMQTTDPSATDAVNLAAQNVYAYVRHMNSGHANYDVPDLMLYLLAYDQISMYHSWLKRIYGVARYYSQYNWYLGKYLLNSMGVNAGDIATHLADFRQAINMLAAQMEMFFVPSTFPIFTRHKYMYENIYMDDMSVKAQFFYFDPQTFGKYVAMTGDQTYGIIAAASPTATGGGQYTVDDMISFGQALINAFVTQEDCGIISGDIKKTYNDAGLMHLDLINDDYVVTPVFVPELLEQIHNAKAMGAPTYTTLNGNNVLFAQNPTSNLIYEGFKFPDGWVELYAPGEVLFNIHTDAVSPADVMIASRLTAMVEAADGTLGAHGSEVVANIYIYTATANGVSARRVYTYHVIESTASMSSVAGIARNFTFLSNFNFAPLVTLDCYNGSKFDRSFIGNLYNVTVMTTDDLADMNAVAMMGLFGIPIAGTYDAK